LKAVPIFFPFVPFKARQEELAHDLPILKTAKSKRVVVRVVLKKSLIFAGNELDVLKDVQK
jgi:hypothetical protein